MDAKLDEIRLRSHDKEGDEPAPAGTMASVAFGRSLIAALAGFAVWMLPIPTGRSAEPAPPEASSVSPAATGNSETLNGAVSQRPASDMAELERLRISSQTWRRGGLGSKALVTFTLRNDNEYAVKDIEIACAFVRRDGSHLTDRGRVLTDTVGMRSRKTFVRIPLGYINVNADQAKCSLIAARRA